MKGNVLINGESQTKLSVFERAAQFGDGVFETCLLHNGNILFWHLHFQRLCLGLERLKIAPIAAQDLLNDIEKIKRHDCVIKILISRGQSLRGYGFDANIKPTRVVMCSEVPTFKDKYQLSVCKSHYAYNPALAGIKHNNRLEQILARASIGTDEGIMLDYQGYVISATAANIFLIKNGVIKTPDLSHCGIQGTRRSLIIQKTKTVVTQITLEDLLAADEVFLTSAIIGIKKVSQIEQHTFSTHTLTNEISF